jgi:hypothetical protein
MFTKKHCNFQNTVFSVVEEYLYCETDLVKDEMSSWDCNHGEPLIDKMDIDLGPGINAKHCLDGDQTEPTPSGPQNYESRWRGHEQRENSICQNSSAQLDTPKGCHFPLSNRFFFYMLSNMFPHMKVSITCYFNEECTKCDPTVI